MLVLAPKLHTALALKEKYESAGTMGKLEEMLTDRRIRRVSIHPFNYTDLFDAEKYREYVEGQVRMLRDNSAFIVFSKREDYQRAVDIFSEYGEKFEPKNRVIYSGGRIWCAREQPFAYAAIYRELVNPDALLFFFMGMYNNACGKEGRDDARRVLDANGRQYAQIGTNLLVSKNLHDLVGEQRQQRIPNSI